MHVFFEFLTKSGITYGFGKFCFAFSGNSVGCANCSNNLKEEDLCLNVDIDELYASLFMTVPIHLLSYQVSRLKGHNLEKSTYPEFDEITSSKIKRI